MCNCGKKRHKKECLRRDFRDIPTKHVDAGGRESCGGQNVCVCHCCVCPCIRHCGNTNRYNDF